MSTMTRRQRGPAWRATLGATLLGATTLAALPSPALAQSATTALLPPPPPSGPDDAEVIARTAWIQAAFDAEAPAAGRWHRMFLVGTSGALLVQGVGGFAIEDPRLQPQLFVGAVTSLIGTIPLLLTFTPALAADQLRATPGETVTQRRARLERAEALLARSEANEAFGRSWLPHVGTGALALAGSAVLLFGFGLPVPALVNLAVVLTVGEIRIWTQPSGLLTAARQYRAGEWRNTAALRSRSSGMQFVGAGPFVLPSGGAGASFTVSF